MPQIGWFEILIVVGIAIVVIGPKDFPIMLKKIGSWIGTAKRYVNQIQEEVSIIGENDNENEIKNNEKKKISKGEDDKN
jgi:sec-independent protein translocase protein TatB|tara:strand:- start:2733 stop:2969 length:237 start_codon:yes stop_codon:yes gene_type:complete